jgi:hypothetical protein
LGKSFSQTLRAELNAGEAGSIPIPEWIVITPWLLGSGKFVTPCLRMQAENFAPSAVPTFIAIWNCWTWLPPAPPDAFSPDPDPPCVVVVAAVPEEATLATPGEPPPPPQPAAMSTKAPTAIAEVMIIGRRLRIVFSSFLSARVDCREG